MVTGDRRNPRLTAIVLNWKKGDLTRICVQSLLESGYGNLSVIVVDNNSGDGSVELLTDALPEVEVIENDANLGFSRGCNIGIRAAIAGGAELIALINNDLVVAPGAFEDPLQILSAQTGVAAVTGKIFTSEPGIIWQAGGRVSRWRVSGVARGRLEMDRGQFDMEEQTGWASGAMSIFRVDALMEAGLLPEEYFFGQEEWDISSRLLSLGHLIVYTPGFVGRHGVGGSYESHPVLNSYGGTRNRHLYAEKYLSRIGYLLWRGTLRLYSRTVMPLNLSRVHGRRSAQAHVAAVRLACQRHRPGLPVTLAELEDVIVELGARSTWES